MIFQDKKVRAGQPRQRSNMSKADDGDCLS